MASKLLLHLRRSVPKGMSISRALSSLVRYQIMDQRTLISNVGATLWGADWQSPMAAALNRDRSTIIAWAVGRACPSASKWRDLREAVRRHSLKLAELDAQIVGAYDAAYQAELKRR